MATPARREEMRLWTFEEAITETAHHRNNSPQQWRECFQGTDEPDPARAYWLEPLVKSRFAAWELRLYGSAEGNGTLSPEKEAFLKRKHKKFTKLADGLREKHSVNLKRDHGERPLGRWNSLVLSDDSQEGGNGSGSLSQSNGRGRGDASESDSDIEIIGSDPGPSQTGKRSNATASVTPNLQDDLGGRDDGQYGNGSSSRTTRQLSPELYLPTTEDGEEADDEDAMSGIEVISQRKVDKGKRRAISIDEDESTSTESSRSLRVRGRGKGKGKGKAREDTAEDSAQTEESSDEATYVKPRDQKKKQRAKRGNPPPLPSVFGKLVAESRPSTGTRAKHSTTSRRQDGVARSYEPFLDEQILLEAFGLPIPTPNKKPQYTIDRVSLHIKRPDGTKEYRSLLELADKVWFAKLKKWQLVLTGWARPWTSSNSSAIKENGMTDDEEAEDNDAQESDDDEEEVKKRRTRQEQKNEARLKKSLERSKPKSVYLDPDPEWFDMDDDDIPSSPIASPTKRIRIEIGARDITAVRPEDHGFWLDTKLGQWLILRPSTNYSPHFEDSQRYFNFFAFGVENGIYGNPTESNTRTEEDAKKALDKMRAEFQDKIVKGSEPSTVPRAYRMKCTTLYELMEDDSVLEGFIRLLAQHLPHPVFVPPWIYVRIYKYYPSTMLRTDPEFDLAIYEEILEKQNKIYEEVMNDHQGINTYNSTLHEFADSGNRAKICLSTGKKETTEDILRVECVKFHPEKRKGESEKSKSEPISIYEKDFVTVLGEGPKALHKQPVNDDDSEREFEPLAPSKSGPTGDVEKLDTVWIGQILYLFEVSGHKTHWAHVRWYQPARQTHLGLLAPALELCVVDGTRYDSQTHDGHGCSHIRLDTIIKKIDVEILGPGDVATETTNFYTRFGCEWSTGAFKDRTLFTELPAYPNCESEDFPNCASCEVEQERLLKGSHTKFFPASKKGVSCESTEVLHGGKLYHTNDYVYIHPREGIQLGTEEKDLQYANRPAAYRLGRIVNLRSRNDSTKYLAVEWIFRRDELVIQDEKNERQLVLSSYGQDEVAWLSIEGKFKLQQRNGRPVDYSPHMLEGISKEEGDELVDASQEEQLDLLNRAMNDSDAFWTCERIKTKVLDDDGKQTDLEDGSPSKLRTPMILEKLESGFTLPGCSSCTKEHRTRLELLASTAPALRAFELYSGIGGLAFGLKEGYPELKCVGIVETNRETGEAFKRNLDYPTNWLNEQRPVSQVVEDTYYKLLEDPEGSSLLPALQNLGLISGGPPCQGFSIANRYPRREDVRCLEIFAWLGMVLQMQPKFALLENVRPLATFALPQNDPNGGDARGGLLKLTQSLLIAAGYQVRVIIANAAAHGAPQVRRRLLLVAARHGMPLLEGLETTHAFDRNALSLDITGAYDTERRTASFSARSQGFAPHKAVTVEDAIGDLSLVDALSDDHGKFTISGPPQSLFQRACRTSQRGDLLYKSTEHKEPPQTDLYEPLLDSIPEGGNYADVPEERRKKLGLHVPMHLRFRSQERKLKDFFRRLHGVDLFTPMRTSYNIDGASHGPRIHYKHNRGVTFRELARIQGFPDTFCFRSGPEVNDGAVIRHIGNSVPTVLARALGVELRKAVVLSGNDLNFDEGLVTRRRRALLVQLPMRKKVKRKVEEIEIVAESDDDEMDVSQGEAHEAPSHKKPRNNESQESFVAGSTSKSRKALKRL